MSSLFVSAQGPHITQHGQTSGVSHGVAEHTKQDESTVSGVEQAPGPPPPLAMLSTPELFSLSNRTILVTGGARGLGLTIVQSLLECGANVAALDLLPHPSESEWPKMQELAESKGSDLSYTSLDITDQDSVHSAFSKIFDAAKPSAPVRGLFHAAGIQLLMPALKYTPQQMRKIIDVNATGSLLCSQAFAKEWMTRNGSLEYGMDPAKKRTSIAPGIQEGTGLAVSGGASIVMTASMSGHVANKGLWCAAYNASKAAVITMSKCLAMEWSPHGIRVNTLSPGYIRTALTAALLDESPELNETWLAGGLMGRLSTPDEFRGPAVFLLSDASSFMTGADLLVDGGHTAT